MLNYSVIMRFLMLSLMLFLSNLILAQDGVISIKVVDFDTREALISASVVINDTGEYTDYNGDFILNESASGVVEVSYVGYDTREIMIAELIDSDRVLALRPSSQLLKTAVITGSKYSRSLEESTVSIDVIKPQFIKSINTVDMEEVLGRVPGVQIVDGQANIRGGSGFSYGAGSRVLLLINDMPALQPDAGLINFSDIPVENVAQVEILKGAGSTLYGSAAMNGIINVRTGYPTSTPVTEASISYTHYMTPQDAGKQWWDESPRGMAASLLHKRQVGKLDVAASMFYYSLNSYNQYTEEDRGRVTLETRYRQSDRLNYGVNININKNENTNFFIWNFKAAHEGLESTVSSSNSLRYTIDPYVNYSDKYGNQHKFKSRYYYINNDNNMDQANRSNNFFGEYQIKRNIKALDLDVNVGAVYSKLFTDSSLFGDVEFQARNAALYVQADKKLFDKLLLTAGVRYENNSLNTPDVFLGDTIQDFGKRDSEMISRVAANYQLAEATFLRGSWGQGYRFPTITERYIRTEFSSFQIFPNVNLKPEYGWSSELAIKQGFRLFGFEGFIDISQFWQRYDDMMEFVFFNDADGNSGFQSQNIGNTSITGTEVGIGGQSSVFGLPLRIYGGYTYINPTYRDFEENEAVRNSISTDQNVLKYRTKHNLKLDIEIEYKGIKLGGNIERTSHMINIDKQFEIINRIGEYRNANNTGFMLLGARIVYEYKGIRSSVILNNALNEEYTQRPGLLEAPRNVAVRMDYKF